jgi:hypothetical protein
MKRSVLLLALLCAAGSTRAQDSLRIEEIGLQGYYQGTSPTPLRIHVPASARTQTVQLEFTIDSSDTPRGIGTTRADEFQKPVAMRAGEAAEVEVPLLIPQAGRVDLLITEKDGTGHEVEKASKVLRSLTVHEGQLFQLGQESLIVIYCRDEKLCQQAQSQIEFGGGTKESAAKNKQLKFAHIQKLRRYWWSYAVAKAIVIAGPLRATGLVESTALEEYARAGGLLVVLDREAARPDFLSPYRSENSRMGYFRVGSGEFLRMSDLASGELGKWYASTKEFELLPMVAAFPQWGGPDSVLNRVGLSFRFPRLRSLLIWLAVYILVVGLANFTVLRWLKRLEWGWVTVTALALIFGAGMYIASSRGRPKQGTLDEVSILRMDPHSRLAFADVEIRVSSPERREVGIEVDSDDIVIPQQGYQPPDSADINLAANITDKHQVTPGWDVNFGPPLGIEMPMLRWSLRDVHLKGFREIGGTVRWTSPMHLKNETRRQLRQAIYFDFSENKRYLLPAMAPGEEIDLSGVTQKKIWEKVGDDNRRIPWEDAKILESREAGPFLLTELPYSSFVFKASQVFVGLSDEPARKARLETGGALRESVALIVVSMGEA